MYILKIENVKVQTTPCDVHEFEYIIDINILRREIESLPLLLVPTILMYVLNILQIYILLKVGLK